MGREPFTDRATVRSNATAAALLAAQPLYEGGISVVKADFKVPGGEHRNVTFKQRPLGMKFKKGTALVSGIVPGSPADQFDIQVGWELFGINGHDLTAAEIDHMHDTLKEAVSNLADN